MLLRPNIIPLVFKIDAQSALAIRKAAQRQKVPLSEWLRRVVAAHIKKSLKPPKIQKPVTLPTRLLTVNSKITSNTPCLYHGVQMTLMEMTRHLGVSFIFVFRRLEKGQSLESIAVECERRANE